MKAATVASSASSGGRCTPSASASCLNSSPHSIAPPLPPPPTLLRRALLPPSLLLSPSPLTICSPPIPPGGTRPGRAAAPCPTAPPPEATGRDASDALGDEVSVWLSAGGKSSLPRCSALRSSSCASGPVCCTAHHHRASDHTRATTSQRDKQRGASPSQSDKENENMPGGSGQFRSLAALPADRSLESSP